MNKIINAVAITAFFSFTSCLEDQFSNLVTSQKASSVEELQVSTDFTWATSKTVYLQVLGLPTSLPIMSTLKISADGQVYYTGLHALSDTLYLKVLVPATVRELNLSMGTIQSKTLITGDKAVFSYIGSNGN